MGKGGSTNSVEYPAWLEDAARRNLNQADRISRIGSVPMSYGPTVAAFTPMQNSSFLNTANAASAFGLDASTGTAVTGGMDAPTTYANGVTAYSALPIYNETMDEFRLDRPGQASYIDSFFIDPFTGQPGSNVASVASAPAPVASSGGSGGGRDPYHGGDSVVDFLDPNDRMGLRDTMNRTNFAEGVTSNTYGINDKGDVVAIGDEAGQVDPGLAAAAGYTRTTDTNPFDMSFTEHLGAMAKDVSEIPGKVKDDVEAKAEGDCVIATHAISTGAYNYQTRREAEVWCMRRLHNKWWGETIRRGYRYLGRQKIDQGKASEHYDEFKRYIAFATGKKRDLRGALTFTLRSVQFFAVGLFARNS